MEQIGKREISHNEVSQAAETVFGYLKVENQPQKAEVIFILGGSSLEPVKRAAQLYYEGFAPKIAFVSQGGKFGGETIWGMSEVEKYKQILFELGIPESDILCEEDRSKQTRNTLAESKYAIPFLKEHGMQPKKMILVSRPIHQRRAFSTFSRQHPGIEYVNCPAIEPLDSNDPEQLLRLVQEIERLLDYGVRMGTIIYPEIPVEVLRSAAVLREFLRTNEKTKGIYRLRQKPSIVKKS